MRERIKEHDGDIRFAPTQTSTVSEHANETGHIPIWSKVKFIERDLHWYTHRVKEAIHIRLYPNNINRDSGIDILEAWIPTIKKHNSRFMRTYEGTLSNDRNNNEDRNAPIAAYQRVTNSKQSTSSPDEDWQYCSRNVAIYIISDSIVRQTNKVHLLSYTTMNDMHIFYYNSYYLLMPLPLLLPIVLVSIKVLRRLG